MTKLSRRALMAASAAGMALAAGQARAQQAVTLDFPSWQAEEPGVAEWWRALIAEFERTHPGVRINL